MSLILTHRKGFNALPTELCDIIADILSSSGDLTTLSRFSRLQRRLVDVANRAYYRTATTTAVETLALPDLERSRAFGRTWMPTHPAAFVQGLKFTFNLDTCNSNATARDEAKLVAKSQLLGALQNLVRHARGPEVAGRKLPWLTKLRLAFHGLSFAEVFNEDDLGSFVLEDLSLECDFPKNDDEVAGCMMMMNMLNPSTKNLLLNINFCSSQYIGQANLYHFTQLLLQNIPQLAPNLVILLLSLPVWPSSDPVHPLTVFFSGLRFPNLRTFTLYSGNIPLGRRGSKTIDLVPFFIHNPEIVQVNLNDDFGLGGTRGDLNHQLPKALLKLEHFGGTLPNCMVICGLEHGRLAPRPITSLDISIGARKLQWTTVQVLIEMVSRISETLRTLKLRERTNVNQWKGSWTDHGLSFNSYESLFKACERLRELECHLSIRQILLGFLTLISANLSSLRFMRIHVYTAQTVEAFTAGEQSPSRLFGKHAQDSKALALNTRNWIEVGLRDDLLPSLKHRLRFSIVAHGLAPSPSGERSLPVQWSVTLDGEADPVTGIHIHEEKQSGL